MTTIRTPKTLTALCVAALTTVTFAGTAAAESAFSQDRLAAAVQVPTGNRVAMETVGVGSITYECRAKKDAADTFEWFFAGPDARLMDRTGLQVGKYFGPPATWQSMDGSQLTGAQLAVAPNGAGNIPLQLVKANPANGMGSLQDVTFIQRVATVGGTAPALPCAQAQLGQKQVVPYQADYIFWKAM
jgi:hypothetical protein